MADDTRGIVTSGGKQWEPTPEGGHRPVGGWDPSADDEGAMGPPGGVSEEEWYKTHPPKEPSGVSVAETVKPSVGQAETIATSAPTLPPPQPKPLKTLKPDSTRGLVAVAPTYARQHPEAVTKVGKYYYRPAVSAKVFKAAREAGKTREQIYTDAKKARTAIPLAEAEVKLAPVGETAKAEDYVSKKVLNYRPDIVVSRLRAAGAPLSVLLDYIGKHPSISLSTKMSGIINKQLESLGKLKGEAAFNKQVELGFIPRGSIYIDEKSYMPATAIAEIKSKNPDLHEILITKGYKAYQTVVAASQAEYDKWAAQFTPSELAEMRSEKYKVPDPTTGKMVVTTKAKQEAYAEFVSEHTKLADNTWIPNEEWAKIPPRYQGIGERQGFDAMLAAIKEDESRGTFAGNLGRAKEVSGWLNKVKTLLGLTPGDIAEAQARFLTTPPIPEADKKTPELSARQLLAVLVPTITEQPTTPKKADFSDILRAVVAAEQKKVEIGTTGMELDISYLSPKVKGGLKTFAEPLPIGLKQAIKFGGALTLGAVSAPIYSAIVTGHLAQVAWAPDKVGGLTDLGKGMADFFISIPATIVAEPVLATGFYTGLFVVGPKGMAKIVKEVSIRGAPSYIPTRGMGIEYSVVRVPSSVVNRTAVVAAMNKAIVRAMQNKTGTAIVKVGDGLVRLKIKPTPVSEVVGPALYHATPALTKVLRKGQVKGTLYTSPHLAVRFAESSATGVPQSNPAVLMIFTKDGKMKWSPTTNLYKGAKEMEAVYGSTKLVRVKNLWSRLTFDRFGDFITVHKGQAIPIYRFREPGGVAPRIGITDLINIRIKAAAAGLTDLLKGKKGYEIIKDTAKEAGRVEVELLLKPYEYLFKTLAKMYRANPNIEKLYRLNPERFEKVYLDELNRQFEYATRRKPFMAGEEFTETERQQLERGVIPSKLRRLQPKEERVTERSLRQLRIPPEKIPERVTPLRDRPTRVPPERVPPKTPPPTRVPPTLPPPALIRLQTQSPMSQPIPDGSIAWKQGLFWKYVAPKDFTSGTKPQTLPEGIIPTGAVKTDLRTPAETIQMIGRSRTARVPKTITIDTGVVDIKVSERGRRIEFTGGGLTTNVGKRIASRTTGMSVLDGGDELTDMDEPLYGRKRVSRPMMSKRKPPRKGKRTNWLDDLTSLRGVRW